MSTAEALLVATGVALLAATATRHALALRGGAVLAGGLALLAWHGTGAAGVLGIVAAALALLNLFHLALLLLARVRHRFTPEEQAMCGHALAALDRAQARHLLDQGMWIDGKAGEVLIRERAPVSHLFYLAAGTAEVTGEGRRIATAAAPTFLGEITVLDESGAIATVTLAEPSRFWCVPAGELRLFLRENPPIRVALEHGFVGTLADKLRLSNRAIMAGHAPG